MDIKKTVDELLSHDLEQMRKYVTEQPEAIFDKDRLTHLRGLLAILVAQEQMDAISEFEQQDKEVLMKLLEDIKNVREGTAPKRAPRKKAPQAKKATSTRKSKAASSKSGSAGKED